MNKNSVLYILLIISTFCFFAGASFGQGPSMSYGEQLLSITDQECMRRTPLAYRAEGFTPEDPSVNTTYGYKGIHSAYIRCLGEPEKGRTRVIIVVGSNTSDRNVPGGERVRLQGRMETPPVDAVPPPPPVVSGRWTYKDGNFTDTHVFYANGTLSAPSSSSVTATWVVEGKELVVRWSNGWSNRYQLPVVSGKLYGTAFGPSGQRSQITLSQQ